MAERIGQSTTNLVPKLKVRAEIDIRLPFAERNRQPAAGADRRDGAADLAGDAIHRLADVPQVLEIGSRTDVHVQAGDFQAVPVGAAEAIGDFLMPDAVLRLLAARVP